MKKTNGKVSAPTQNRSGQPSSIMCSPASHPSCPTRHMNSHPIKNNNEQSPPPPHMNSMLSTSKSKCLKKRLFSTTKTNSAREFEFEFINQPRNEFVHDSTSKPTPRLHSNSEGEENVDIEMQSNQSKHVSRKRSWLVNVIGTQVRKQLTLNDVWFLSPSERILVKWNSDNQPIDDSGALLNRFLGRVVRNVNAFPISYQSWRKIPNEYKEDILKKTIQAKFLVESNAHVTYILKSLNIKWSEYRQQLWQQKDDGTRNRDEIITMCAEGMNRDQWASFVDYHLNSRTKEIAQKNKDNRKKQTVPHTGGSKSIARKKDEMEQELGHKVSRGEVWIATHKHANGEFVNDGAKEIGEKIKAYETNTSSLSQDISIEDSLAHVLGSKEHCGHVRGMGLGPCPSRVF
ncbi:uncharacterized protein LOC114172261 [Vigna unguiculata]|uniref:uncharacterized protein LOC114172261 n=1 Tax=Vigna unguiculata TaxID=3917 RepID=UPI00101661AC|nr:uncharacterized protein LOC114172261 [Vigna unguiculata]